MLQAASVRLQSSGLPSRLLLSSPHKIGQGQIGCGMASLSLPSSPFYTLPGWGLQLHKLLSRQQSLDRTMVSGIIGCWGNTPSAILLR